MERPSIFLMFRRSNSFAAFPALSIPSGRIPSFSREAFCFSVGGAISQPNAGTYPASSSAWMLISNWMGSTSFFFLWRISSSCLARDSSRSAITSSEAFFSACSISTGQPAACSRSAVILCATSFLVQMMSAGWQSSCRSVCHRKSRRRRYSFPGCSLVPLPTIWLYRLRTRVGRSTTMQSTDGQSQPSVRSMELHRTLYSPLSNASRISARSLLSPLTSAALNPRSVRMSRNFRLVFTRGRNTTVFRSVQYFFISSAIWYRYGSSAVATSPAFKSPDWMETPDRSSFNGMVRAFIGDKYPSLMAFGSVYS